MPQREPGGAIERVLVTGGAGFLGFHLVRRLSKDYDVGIFDIAEPDPEAGHTHFVRGDILATPLLEDTVQGYDAVIHLAAQLGVAASQRDEQRVLAVNVAGTESLEAAIRSSVRVRRVVALSSSEVYGEGRDRLLEEGSELAPRSAYGRTKVVMEQLVSSLATASRSVAIIRPFNVYGPRQRPDFVVPRFILAALARSPLTIFGDGTQLRTFTYVGDAVKGVIAALESRRNSSRFVSTYNVASNESVSIYTLASMIRYVTASESELVFLPYSDPRTGRDASQEIIDRVPSTSRARRQLGFQASVSLAEGLLVTARWYQDQLASGGGAASIAL
ncbi:MAG TPA: NAD-dependent epimerase/dehydratase family protein [Acidimicrobiales bacterium]|nr:NAD-dependent epimerase/dehydratase family protein [Acidimicrobiales bacterium]